MNAVEAQDVGSSVGGFLGVGTKYVVVRLSSLHMQDNKVVLPGATKDALTALPEFRYNR
jgi:hypothetical protein